jgi:hypothetical protein
MALNSKPHAPATLPLIPVVEETGLAPRPVWTLSVPVTEPWFLSGPGRNLVTTPTELRRLLLRTISLLEVRSIAAAPFMRSLEKWLIRQEYSFCVRVCQWQLGIISLTHRPEFLSSTTIPAWEKYWDLSHNGEAFLQRLLWKKQLHIERNIVSGFARSIPAVSRGWLLISG